MEHLFLQSKAYYLLPERFGESKVRKSRPWLTRQIFLLCWAFILLLPAATYAQLVGNAAVKANFGVDADVYANTLQFGPVVGEKFNTDDWFQNYSLFPGTGVGVIDVSNAASLKNSILANRNFSFEKRMAYPKNSVVNNHLLLDAIYYRDNNATGNFTDASVFSGSSNKNGDNPTTWSLGSGGTPPKNDIVDVFGHIRRDGTTVSSDLWAFGGATTMSADGNSHNDFEFFRTAVGYSGTALTNAGPDFGHTAWTFNPDGSVKTPGDILVAVDFENGGTVPNASVRIWIQNPDIAAFNAKANKPFRLTGTFDGSSNAGGFGYAGIDTKDPNAPAAVFARVNTTGATLGAPWGSLEGGAAFQDNILQLQFSEFGINLTALGLDATNSSTLGPCFNLLGSLLVKTRSSSSFTAELKDFAGPFLFGNNTDVDVTAQVSGKLTCTTASVTLSATGITPAGATIAWFGPKTGENVGPALAGTSPVITQPGIYTVRASAGPTGCFKESTVTVEQDITKPVVTAAAPNKLTCIVASVSLTGTSSVSGAGVTYAWTGPAGATITGGSTLSPTVNMPGEYTLTVTGANGCSETAKATVQQDASKPVVTAAAPLTKLNCINSTIQLTGTSSVSGEGVTILWTGPAGATITNANTLTATVNMPGSYTLTVTGANGCSESASVTVEQDIAKPEVTAAALTKLTCSVTTVGLTGTSSVSGNGVTILWTGPAGAVITGANTLTPSVNLPGEYTLTVTGVNGCSQSAKATVQQDITKPVVTAAAPNKLTCSVLTVGLTGTASVSGEGVTYAWTGPVGATITGGSTLSSTVNMIGEYTLTVTGANGCTETAKATVQQDIAKPVVTASANNTLTCSVLTVGLTGTSSVSGAGVTYAWTGPAGAIITNGNTLTPTVNLPGEYTLTVTGTNGCSQTAKATVQQDANKPVVTAAAPNKLTCAALTVSLTGTSSVSGAGVTFAWTGPVGATITNGSTLTPSVNMPGEYTLTVTGTNGCSTSAKATVQQDIAKPVLTALATDKLTCSVTTVSLTGTSSVSGNGVTILWTGPAGAVITGANTLTPTVNLPGEYTLTVTGANGCSETAKATVQQDITKPIVTAAAPNKLTCSVSTVSLTGTSSVSGPGVTYAWSGPAGATITNGNTLTPSVNMAGEYTLIVTGANGCSESAKATVQQDVAKPVVTATAPNKLTCTVLSVGLTGTSSVSGVGVTILWTGPVGAVITGANTLTPTVNMVGEYTLTVTAANGCSQTAKATVQQDASQPVVGASAPNKLTCTSLVVSLVGTSSVSGTGVTYAWFGPVGAIITNGNTLTPTVNMAGEYTLTVTGTNGCSASAKVMVQQDIAKPVVSASAPDKITCSRLTVVLTGSSSVSGAGVTYAWTGPAGATITGGSTLTPTVNMIGEYTLTVTGANGCSNSAKVTVTNEPCSDANCTLTQGFYGNKGGKYCDGRTTVQLMTYLLSKYGAGGMVIGKAGVNSLTIKASDAACLISSLPAGGPSVALVGNGVFSSSKCATTNNIPVNKQGRFTNTLLGQTITLGLNLKMDNSTLGSLLIKDVYMTTVKATDCGKAGATPIAGTEKVFTFPLTAVGKTVAQLYAMANEALGGGTTAMSLADLTMTLGAINDGFDECRFLSSFSATPPVFTTVIASVKSRSSDDLMSVPLNNELSAYPNPYTDRATITFNLAEAGDYTLVLHDVKGSVVKRISNGKAVAGTQYSFTIGNDLPAGIYMARLSSAKVNKIIRISLTK